jgi:hypothetical protein
MTLYIYTIYNSMLCAYVRFYYTKNNIKDYVYVTLLKYKNDIFNIKIFRDNSLKISS